MTAVSGGGRHAGVYSVILLVQHNDATDVDSQQVELVHNVSGFTRDQITKLNGTFERADGFEQGERFLFGDTSSSGILERQHGAGQHLDLAVTRPDQMYNIDTTLKIALALDLRLRPLRPNRADMRPCRYSARCDPLGIASYYLLSSCCFYANVLCAVRGGLYAKLQ